MTTVGDKRGWGRPKINICVLSFGLFWRLSINASSLFRILLLTFFLVTGISWFCLLWCCYSLRENGSFNSPLLFSMKYRTIVATIVHYLKPNISKVRYITKENGKKHDQYVWKPTLSDFSIRQLQAIHECEVKLIIKLKYP